MWVHTSGKIYVPKALRRKLLYYYHFSRAGGHQGVTRTYARISKMFWWPDLKSTIQSYNNECLTCQRRRNYVKPQLTGNLLTERSGQIVAIDVVGPVHHKQHIYYIFTIIDHFTKFVEAIVTESITAQTLWHHLFTRWISIWGCPMHLLTDNAATFRSNYFIQKYQSLGIMKIFIHKGTALWKRFISF